jgi:hypothetical protein
MDSVIGITGILGLNGLNSQDQQKEKAGQLIGHKARKERRVGSLQQEQRPWLPRGNSG